MSTQASSECATSGGCLDIDPDVLVAIYQTAGIEPVYRARADQAVKRLASRNASSAIARQRIRVSRREVLAVIGLEILAGFVILVMAPVIAAVNLSQGKLPGALKPLYQTVHGSITHEQVLALFAIAAGVCVSINVALAVDGREGHREAENTAWRSSLSSIARHAAAGTGLLLVLDILAAKDRPIVMVLALIFGWLGIVGLAVTCDQQVNATTRASEFARKLELLADVKAMREQLRTLRVPERSPGGWGSGKVLVAVWGFTVAVMLLPVGVDARWFNHGDPASEYVIVGALVLSATVVIALIATLLSPVVLAGFWGESSRVLRRMYAFMTAIYFLPFGILAVLFEIFVGPIAGAALIAATLGPAVVFGAAYWSRRPHPPRWIAVIAWTAWGRIHRQLKEQERDHRGIAVKHLKEELVLERVTGTHIDEPARQRLWRRVCTWLGSEKATDRRGERLKPR